MDVVFLPGILMPASLRYAPLLRHLPEIRAAVTELAVYQGDAPPAGYGVDAEIAHVAASARRAGFDRFHLYGHSGGGAVALAFAAAHPERVLSLVVDEPASDHTPADHADPYWDEIVAARELPEAEATRAFVRLQLAPDVTPPAPPPGTPPPWMATRPAGIRAFTAALRRHEVDPDRYRRFGAPVLFTHGSRSHPRWRAMRERLAGLFPDFRAEEFAGLHHLHTSHQAEPERTAALLRATWATPTRERA